MDSRNKIIEDLRELIATQSAQLEKQSAQLEKQAARIKALELELAQAKKDSTTSSKPPSSDIAKPKSKRKRSSRKKPRQGGQPGHRRQLREPLPPDRVDEFVECEIDDREVKRLGLTPTGKFEAIQHIELPESPVHVTEYLVLEYQDAKGELYVAHCPELKGPIFGPRLLATIGWLKSAAHCSYTTVESWIKDVLQFPSKAPRQENRSLGRAACRSDAAAVFGMASPRRDDRRRFSAFDDHPSRSFSGDRSQAS